MSTRSDHEQIIAEIDNLLPASAELSLKQGLLEALHDQTYPIDQLWEDLNFEEDQ